MPFGTYHNRCHYYLPMGLPFGGVPERRGGRLTQYCRYCCYLVCGDANYCTEQKRTMSDATAKSPNRCHDFAFNPIDALGENEKGYIPKNPKKKQCDGQISLF